MDNAVLASYERPSPFLLACGFFKYFVQTHILKTQILWESLGLWSEGTFCVCEAEHSVPEMARDSQSEVY